MMFSLLNVTSMLALLTPPAGAEYAAIIPAAIVGITAMLVILLDVFHRAETSRDYLGYVSAIGLAAAIFGCWALWDQTLSEPTFFGMLYLDKFSLFFAALCAASGIVGVLLSPAYLRSQGMDRGEYYMLVLFAVSGMMVMASAADLLTIFIGLELMSMPVFVLAAFLRRSSKSAEAGLKYFILGAFSTALMLYGIALVYGVTGTTNLEVIADNLRVLFASPEATLAGGKMLILGTMLVLSGFAFKVAAAPFHVWTPDVYEGSPTPAVGFMATAVKAAAFAGMLRVLIGAFYGDALRGGFEGYGWIDILFALSALSIVLGNLAAIAQDNVKRMLAYSSIAHAGYILVGVVAANSRPDFFLYNDAVLFYLVAYTFGTLGAFGVLAYLGRQGHEAETYGDLGGVGFSHPFLGLVMAVCMFSSAGIPPTAGFLGKLYIFRAAVDAGAQSGEFAFIGLTILAVLTSVAGVYYYLRVLVFMYMRPAETKKSVTALEHSGAKFALVISAILTLYLGIFPDSAITLAREAIVDMEGAPIEVEATQAAGALLLEAAEAE